MPFTDAQIREGIYQQYQSRVPRPGLEIERFVEEQCTYFGIDDRKCRRIIGEAKGAYDAQFRNGLQTATQKIADAMGITRAEILQTVRDCMHATKRRELPPKPGDPEGQDPRYEYLPDNRTRLAAADLAAKLIGAHAPKQVQIEATHEHTLTITDDELRAEFAALAGGFGLKVIDAEFASVGGGTGAGRAIAAGDETPASQD